MGKVLLSLVLAAAALGALTAILLSGPVVALVPAVGIAVAVLLFTLRHRNGFVAGGLLLLFCLGALVVSVGGISFKGGNGVGESDDSTGNAAAVATAVVAAGALLGISWGRLEPAWMPYAWLVVLLAGLGLTFGFKDDLGNPLALGSYLSGLLVLAGGVPALMMMLRGEDLSA